MLKKQELRGGLLSHGTAYGKCGVFHANLRAVRGNVLHPRLNDSAQKQRKKTLFAKWNKHIRNSFVFQVFRDIALLATLKGTAGCHYFQRQFASAGLDIMGLKP